MFIGMSSSHALADKQSVCPADIKDEIAIKNNSHFGIDWSGLFRDSAKGGNIVYMDYSLPSVVEDFVSSGGAILPTQIYLDAQRKYPRLRFVPLEPFRGSSFCCFVFQRQFQTQALRRFRKCAEKVAQDIALELDADI